MMQLRIAGTVENSIVDGEGIRYTIFVQGCPHGCPGCHNPQTHDFAGGHIADVEQILSLLQQKPDGTEGILSKDQLRNSKNMFIAGITLFTRAAIDGGVPEETAYSLSDGYIQTVEECTNSVSIEKLSQRAAARFAQEVYDPRKRMEMIPYLVTSRNIC